MVSHCCPQWEADWLPHSPLKLKDPGLKIAYARDFPKIAYSPHWGWVVDSLHSCGRVRWLDVVSHLSYTKGAFPLHQSALDRTQLAFVLTSDLRSKAPFHSKQVRPSDARS